MRSVALSLWSPFRPSSADRKGRNLSDVPGRVEKKSKEDSRAAFLILQKSTHTKGESLTVDLIGKAAFSE